MAHSDNKMLLLVFFCIHLEQIRKFLQLNLTWMGANEQKFKFCDYVCRH